MKYIIIVFGLIIISCTTNENFKDNIMENGINEKIHVQINGIENIYYNILFYFFRQYILYSILGQMAYNVLAVYDVLPARIRALRSKDQGWQNVAEFWRGNERID
jgi:hypothetical protein